MSLSVIIPHYNHGKLIGEALEAIFAQTYQPTEVIIIDDASTDGSDLVVEKYAKIYPQIKFLRNEANIGVAATVNKAVKLSRGEFLVFCAADDLILPGFFEKTMAFMLKNPQLGLCTSKARYFNETWSKDDVFTEFDTHAQVIDPEKLVKHILKTGFYIPSHASIYRKKSIRTLFDPELHAACDFYLNYQIAFTQPIGFVPEVLGAMRISPSSYSAIISRQVRSRTYHRLLKLMRQEDPVLQKRLRQSALLAFLGFSMIRYLLARPMSWSYLPYIFYKKGRNRVRRLCTWFSR